MNLKSYKNQGKSFFIKHIIWYFFECILFSSFIPGSLWRCLFLRIFGGKIGHGVIIKPFVKIKFPWNLEIGNYSWIGEEVWIDNLDVVKIGSNCCISQGAYICTGNHDYKKDSFDLITKPIIIKDQVWLGANSIISPGIRIEEGTVLCISSVLLSNTDKWSIYQGNPAKFIRKRGEDIS